jgi:hypothetical protein
MSFTNISLVVSLFGLGRSQLHLIIGPRGNDFEAVFWKSLLNGQLIVRQPIHAIHLITCALDLAFNLSELNLRVLFLTLESRELFSLIAMRSCRVLKELFSMIFPKVKLGPPAGVSNVIRPVVSCH